MLKKAKKKIEVEEVAEVVVSGAPCEDCSGSGLKDANNLCASCKGHGKK